MIVNIIGGISLIMALCVFLVGMFTSDGKPRDIWFALYLIAAAICFK